MFNVTEPLANTLFAWSNVVLIAGAAAVLIGTIGAIAMGSAKEQFASERISANEAETSRAKADAETAKEGAAQANARALEAQVALATIRAPRTLTVPQQAALMAVAARHKGLTLHIFMVGDSADIRPLAETFAKLFKDGGGWHSEIWTWTGVGPIQKVVVLTKKGARPESVAAATELLQALDGPGVPAPQQWPGDWDKFGGLLNGPDFKADAAEIRLIVGSKPL